MESAIGKLPPKVSIIPGASSDLSATTYIVREESHTLGNTLRWMLMKNPKVEFCGYSVPHPMERNFQLRIQMYDSQSSLQALLKALDDLDELFQVISNKYKEDMAKKEYEWFHEEA